MSRDQINLYKLSGESESELWNDAIVTFDTSSLLYFYEYSDNTKNEIIGELISHLNNRLWIPHHVSYEFLKNRERVIRSPISAKGKYKEIENDYVVGIGKHLEDIEKKTEELHKRIKKQDMHPHLNEDIVIKFKSISDEYKSEYKSFRKEVEEEIDKRKCEINNLIEDDLVLDFINTTCEVGEEYSIEKIFKVIEESNFRFPNKIAPGWLDEKEKVGIQRVADLIIWKQVLDHSKEKGKPIILVINDVKEDWCHSKKHGNEYRIEKPRDELIKEMYDITSNVF